MQYPVSISGDHEFPVPFRNWLKTILFFIKSRYQVKTVTAAYTVEEDRYLILADGTGGAFTVTLPSPVDRIGREIIIKRTGAAGVITIGGTVDGTVNPTLGAQYVKMVVISDGTLWHDIT